MVPLKFLSWNLRGLNLSKVTEIKNTVEGFDIICFQETHVDESKKHLLVNLFPNRNVFYSTASSSRLGVAVILKENINYQNVVIDLEGRFISIDLIDPIKTRLINVYAPANNKMERKLFFEKLNDYMSDLDNIVLGDMNVVTKQADKSTENFKMTEDKKEFMSLVEKNRLVDIGDKFRSTNVFTFRSNTNRFSRIDYILVSECLSAKARNFEIIRSLSPNYDHAAITMEFDTQIPKLKSNRWFFNDCYLENSDFVRNTKSYLENLPSYDWWSSFKLGIKKITKWYSYNSTKKTKSRLEEINEFLNDNWMNIDQKYIDLAKEKQLIEEKIAKGKALRAKQNWNKNAELPSTFFSSCISSRAKECKMEIPAEQIFKFYNNLHEKKQTSESTQEKFLGMSKKISNSMRNELESEITIEEIKLSISQLRNTSSPGIDGLTPRFYKTFKNEIAPILKNLFQNCLLNGKLDEGMRTAIVRFIAKKNADLKTVKGFRPISLLNIDAKIFSLIFAKRLQSTLKILIHDDQKAYINKRNIIENVIYVQNIIEQQKSCFLLTTDFSAAFDSISHDFIIKLLEKSNFGPFMVNAIKTMLKDLVAYPIIDGSIDKSDQIKINNGVRQGDPISGLLFVLAVEPLLEMIRRNATKVELTDGIGKTTLGYADDLIFILKTKKDVKKSIKIILDFKDCSSLSINPAKSSIIPIGSIADFETNGVKTACNFSYLGHELSKTNVENNYDKRIKLMKESFEKWKRLNLSLIGKKTVINSYIAPQLFYNMTVVSLTINQQKLLNKMFRWFLAPTKMKFSESKSYTQLMSLKRYQKSHEFGGFGIINLLARQYTFKITLLKKLLIQDHWIGNLIKNFLDGIEKKKKLDVSPIFISRQWNKMKIPIFIKEILLATNNIKISSQMNKYSYCKSVELNELFINTITLSEYPYYNHDTIQKSTKEIRSKEIYKSLVYNLNKEDVLSSKQIEWFKKWNLNFGETWKWILKLKVRRMVKSFLFKIWNDALFVPTFNKNHAIANVEHLFLESQEMKQVSKHFNIDLENFLKNPTSFKEKDTLMVFAIYKSLTNFYFNRLDFDFIHFIKKVESNFKSEEEQF
jgi:exonuclease III